MALALSDLRQRFYDLMDEGQNQNYVNPDLADRFIDNAASLLHNFIVTENPWYFYEDITYVPILSVSDYALPTDFRNALKVYASLTPSSTYSTGLRYIPMRQFNTGNYAAFPAQQWGTLTNPIPRYRILGQVLRLDPAPTVAPTNYNVVMWYTPQYQSVATNQNATLSDIFLSGHEQWIVNQAVIYAKMKEEVSFADIAAVNENIKAQIQRDLQMRDHGGGDLILDTDHMEHGDCMWHQWR